MYLPLKQQLQFIFKLVPQIKVLHLRAERGAKYLKIRTKQVWGGLLKLCHLKLY